MMQLQRSFTPTRTPTNAAVTLMGSSYCSDCLSARLVCPYANPARSPAKARGEEEYEAEVKSGGGGLAHGASVPTLCQLLDKIPNSRSNGCMTKHDQDRKTRILQAIAEGSRRSGTPPTVREIADLVGLAAPSAVHHHLETLEREGLIQRDSGLSRSVRLTARGRSLLELDDAVETTNLPMAARELVVVGQIAAGGPIEAYEERSESVAVPEFMSTADSYLLKIRGDSMIDAQIADGDYVVIKPSKVAADGDIVVAQVGENEVTLKQLFRESGRVRLQPANKAYAPMYYTTVNVQGVLVGVLRRVH